MSIMHVVIESLIGVFHTLKDVGIGVLDLYSKLIVGRVGFRLDAINFLDQPFENNDSLLFEDIN